MEIFTSMTFWIIVIAIIVILAIIGYVAEGTILANKKKKEEEKPKEVETTAWTEGTPTESEIKQETVYTVTDNNWLEMPDINAGETIEAPTIEPVQTPVEPTPVAEPVQTPVEPTPVVEPVQAPVEPAVGPAPTIEPIQTPVETLQPQTNPTNSQPVEKQDVWTN